MMDFRLQRLIGPGGEDQVEMELHRPIKLPREHGTTNTTSLGSRIWQGAGTVLRR